MPRLVSTLLLSTLLPIFGAGVYFLCSLLGYEYVGRRYGSFGRTSLVAGAFTWAFVAVAWWWLWRKPVMWTPQRRSRTWVAALASAGAGVVLGIVTGSVETEVGWFVGTAAPPLLWLGATALLWQETDAERVRRTGHVGHGPVLCPECRYDLTGLTAARCPECGTQYTLDELYARQPGRAETLTV